MEHIKTFDEFAKDKKIVYVPTQETLRNVKNLKKELSKIGDASVWDIVSIRTKPTVWQLHVFTDDQKIWDKINYVLKQTMGFVTNIPYQQLKNEFENTKSLYGDGSVLFCSWDSHSTII